MDTMLAELIANGLCNGAICPTMLERINVDTTVQEKFMRFQNDARLYDRMRERLVRKVRDIERKTTTRDGSDGTIAASAAVC